MYKTRLLACLLALGVPALFAQEAPQAASVALPSGESILDKHIEATGGIEAYKKLKNTVAKGTLSISAMGITASVTIYSAEPNLTLRETEFPGLGKMSEGVDGKIAWSNSPMTGPSIKSGKEGQLALNEAIFRDEEWRYKYSKAETLAIETVAGEECYKVKLTPRAGDPMTNYYSKKTALLVKIEGTVDTEMGTITAETLIKDYKKVGDILLPHRMEQKAAGMEAIVVITDAKVNADLPALLFEPPAEVKALISK